ncbi:terpene synthase family protein [Lyngbya aestuarii]|uniref:terpene synthase family protein n=1 Tax=Lyngbya aestuarii TaxID=118322 RepID=UPI00403E2B7F
MENTILPELYCPFPAKLNKHAESLHQHTIEWVRQFNLIEDEATYQRFCRSRLSDLAARVYPEAEWTELKLLSDWNVWFFILDDKLDEGNIGKQPEQLAILNAGLINILKEVGTANQISGLGEALEDIRQRITEQKAEPFLMNQFIRHVEQCLSASVWEATNRSKGIVPDVATYREMRALTSAVTTIFNFILIVLKIELLPEVINHADVQHLAVIANNIICCVNDIFSLEKEMRSGDVHNIVLALQQEHQCTLKEAIQYSIELHNQEIETFIKLETQLLSQRTEVDYQLRRYVSSLRFWISGSLDWHRLSDRYCFKKTVISQSN